LHRRAVLRCPSGQAGSRADHAGARPGALFAVREGAGGTVARLPRPGGHV